MADGDSGIKNLGAELSQAIIKPVIDEVGKAVEQGVQSITGSNQILDPSEQAKKKAEEEKKKQNILNFLHQSQADYEAFQKQKKALEEQRKQAEQTEVVEKKQEENIKEQKKAENPAITSKGKLEIKRGVGD